MDDAEFEDDFKRFMETGSDLKQKITKLKGFILKKTIHENRTSDIAARVARPNQPGQLPKFELKKFSAENPVEWQSFHESFVEAIYKNNSLADIEVAI